MARDHTEYNLDNLKIESGIKKPAVTHRGGRVNKWWLLFIKLKVGDSVALPFTNDNEQKKVSDTIQAAIRNFKVKHEPEWVLSKRTLFNKKEVRVWRDK